MTDRTCRDCSQPLTKRPGRGRWPVRCADCKRKKQAQWRSKNAEALRAKHADRMGPDPRSANPCPICNGPITRPRGGPTGTTCGTRLCAERDRRSRRTPEQHAAELARRRRLNADRRIWISCRCWECGQSFLTTKPLKFCERRCMRAAHSRARKQREKGLANAKPIDRWRVFRLDNWVCHICGDPVNREAEVPELDAPTVDHVIPIIRGGTNDPSNLKCAHFWCNSLKSDLDLADVA